MVGRGVGVRRCSDKVVDVRCEFRVQGLGRRCCAKVIGVACLPVKREHQDLEISVCS